MTYTLGDIDWEKFQSKYGFGAGLEYADSNQVADDLTLPAGLGDDPDEWDQVIREELPWFTCEVALYTAHDDVFNEFERDCGDRADFDKFHAFAQERGFEPERIISQKVMFTRDPFVNDEYVFSDGVVSHYIIVDSISSNGYDVDGYDAEDYPYVETLDDLLSLVAEKNDADVAVFTKVPPEMYERHTVRRLVKSVSLEEAIANGCGSGN